MWNSILKNTQGAISTGIEFVEDRVDDVSNEVEYRSKQLDQLRDSTFGTAGTNSWETNTTALVQKTVDNSVLGIAEEGAVILGGNTAEKVGLPRGVGEFVGGALAPGFAASKAFLIAAVISYLPAIALTSPPASTNFNAFLYKAEVLLVICSFAVLPE